MSKTLELKDLSNYALADTRYKWFETLMTGKIDWHPCLICDEVYKIADGNNEEMCEICPLKEQMWCTGISYTSKLHPYYSSDFVTRNRLTWERTVTEYLVWITTEMVRRGMEVI